MNSTKNRTRSPIVTVLTMDTSSSKRLAAYRSLYRPKKKNKTSQKTESARLGAMNEVGTLANVPSHPHSKRARLYKKLAVKSAIASATRRAINSALRDTAVSKKGFCRHGGYMVVFRKGFNSSRVPNKLTYISFDIQVRSIFCKKDRFGSFFIHLLPVVLLGGHCTELPTGVA